MVDAPGQYILALGGTPQGTTSCPPWLIPLFLLTAAMEDMIEDMIEISGRQSCCKIKSAPQLLVLVIAPKALACKWLHQKLEMYYETRLKKKSSLKITKVYMF